MNHRFRLVPRLLAMCAALAVLGLSHASDSHGDAHAPAAHAAPAPKAAGGVKLPSKADLKAASMVEGKGEARGESEAKPSARTDAKAEPRTDTKADAKALKPDPKDAKAAAAKGDPLADAKAPVSMSELRDLIDQKIAEVRAKQEAAPVVRLANRAPAQPRRDPALSNAVYSPGPAADAVGASGAVRPSASRSSAKAAAAALAPSSHGAVPAAARGLTGVPERPGADGHDIHWEYGGATGPDTWGSLKPEFKQCLLGKRQSPIDIRDGIRVDLESIQFDYRPTPFTVVDTGHTVQVNMQPGNSITVSGRRYELLQFHFHRPSEERINGRQYEMVAHLVHKDAEGRLAVVAVLMDQGKQHPMVQLVWNSLPLERNTEQTSPVQMDLNLMLPEQRQYYTYMGSLTTPPCSEGVLWMVMKQPATMTREQIDIFARLYPMNARPIQSASGRLIKDGQ